MGVTAIPRHTSESRTGGSRRDHPPYEGQSRERKRVERMQQAGRNATSEAPGAGLEPATVGLTGRRSAD